MGRPAKGSTASIVLIIASSAIALFTIEAAYRLYIFMIEEAIYPFEQVAQNREAVAFRGSPGLWKFDTDTGWRYRTEGYVGGTIQNGAFDRCQVVRHFNDRGNVGRRRGSPTEDHLRGTLIGGRFAMGLDVQGRFLHEALEERLRRSLRRQVWIENASRERYGLIQMIDMAVASIQQDSPDFIIIVFDDTSVLRPRRWRAMKPSGNGFSIPYSLDTAQEKFIHPNNADMLGVVVSDLVTREWCQNMMAAALNGDDDMLRYNPVVMALIEHRRSLRQSAFGRQIDFITNSHSFLYNRLVHQNVYRGVRHLRPGRARHQKLSIDNFAKDSKFVDAVRKLQASKIPYVIVRFPSANVDGNDGSSAETLDEERQLKALVDSLTRTTGKAIVDIGALLEEGEVIAAGAWRRGIDWRTSPRGTEFLTGALADVLSKLQIGGAK
jgi:hypothetical protein